MQNSCFRKKDLIGQSLFQRIFRQFPSENSILELNNLLATKEIQTISQKDILDLSNKYKINILSEYKKNTLEFYATYLNYASSDNEISDEEFNNINHLRQILGIDDFTASQIKEDIIAKIYKRYFEEALADGYIDKNEESFLLNLQKELRIDKKVVEGISGSLTEAHFEKYLIPFFKKERISPKEKKQLDSIIENLKINESKKNQLLISKYVKFWEIENGNLPVLNTEIKLTKGELCYFQENAEWYESKGRKQPFDAYQNELQSVDFSKWNYINSGMLHISNNRLLLTTNSGNKIVKHDKIINVIPFTEGIWIVKNAGKDIFVITKSESKKVQIILKRIIKSLKCS